ncbi:hypothetical protein VP01_874g2 [Puccinia sorghi]|uniref:Uncharacterized protein n=1 Tax=Puccinia sorghi TaxID=27349 RepID=A0A0L6U9B9_9BASI|nr:hypothetical protein VP01_874g2 [Puccinia sorghi]
MVAARRWIYTELEVLKVGSGSNKIFAYSRTGVSRPSRRAGSAAIRHLIEIPVTIAILPVNPSEPEYHHTQEPRCVCNTLAVKCHHILILHNGPGPWFLHHRPDPDTPQIECTLAAALAFLIFRSAHPDLPCARKALSSDKCILDEIYKQKKRNERAQRPTLDIPACGGQTRRGSKPCAPQAGCNESKIDARTAAPAMEDSSSHQIKCWGEIIRSPLTKKKTYHGNPFCLSTFSSSRLIDHHHKQMGKEKNCKTSRVQLKASLNCAIFLMDLISISICCHTSHSSLMTQLYRFQSIKNLTHEWIAKTRHYCASQLTLFLQQLSIKEHCHFLVIIKHR